MTAAGHSLTTLLHIMLALYRGRLIGDIGDCCSKAAAAAAVVIGQAPFAVSSTTRAVALHSAVQLASQFAIASVYSQSLRTTDCFIQRNTRVRRCIYAP